MRAGAASIAIAILFAGQFAHAHETAVDLTRLPLGDNRLSTSPKVGWIWPCRIDGDGGGPQGRTWWIRLDGTFDFTVKPVVDGSVTWPHSFSMSVSGARRVFTSNALPSHPTGVFPVAPTDDAYKADPNPNRIAAQDVRFSLPLEPTLAREAGCAPGAVGILLSGTVLFSALDAAGRDAVAHEVQDSCQGHPQRTGTYHYHSVTSCLEDKVQADGHSVLVGYAIDGFGIYGPRGENGKLLASADLDACHGHTHKIEWNGKAADMYHYHGTPDFPYTVGCLRGAYSFDVVAALSGPPPRLPRQFPGQRRPQGPGGQRPPNLSAAAAELGIPQDRLREALGPPPPNFPAAAKNLGISEDALRAALGAPPR